MKSAKPWYVIVGWIIFEGIWIIELAVNLYTGQMTYAEFLSILAFSFVLAAIIFYIIKSRKRRNRENNQ
ncbi:MAG: hypothetical protein J6A88_00740 [Oscillospiraceae bacterium]|nr:hypothetical protein [Oscillospiraceae bacterium]